MTRRNYTLSFSAASSPLLRQNKVEILTLFRSKSIVPSSKSATNRMDWSIQTPNERRKESNQLLAAKNHKSKRVRVQCVTAKEKKKVRVPYQQKRICAPRKSSRGEEDDNHEGTRTPSRRWRRAPVRREEAWRMLARPRRRGIRKVLVWELGSGNLMGTAEPEEVSGMMRGRPSLVLKAKLLLSKATGPVCLVFFIWLISKKFKD